MDRGWEIKGSRQYLRVLSRSSVVMSLPVYNARPREYVQVLFWSENAGFGDKEQCVGIGMISNDWMKGYTGWQAFLDWTGRYRFRSAISIALKLKLGLAGGHSQ